MPRHPAETPPTLPRPSRQPGHRYAAAPSSAGIPSPRKADKCTAQLPPEAVPDTSSYNPAAGRRGKAVSNPPTSVDLIHSLAFPGQPEDAPNPGSPGIIG